MEVLQRTANRGSISTGSYEIDNSLQFNSVESSNPARFTRTNSGTGNRKTFTISFWHKRGYSANSGGVFYRVLNSIRNEYGKYPGLFVFDYRGNVNSTQFLSAFADEDPDNVAESWFKSDMSFRDESAWYHIVIAYDTTQATASNRRSMYVNGVEQTTSQNTDIPQHHQSSWNDNTLHCIGAYEYNLTDASLGGYLAEVHNIDGLKLDATAFGEFDTSGIWKPKEYDGNYGTNGFRLQFKETGTGQDANGLGADTSGNNHHFATVGHTAASQATDTPTNNFCTMNPFWAYANAQVISEGGTKTLHNTSTWAGAKASFGVTSGKWYWEYKTISGNGLDVIIGIQTDEGVALTGNSHNIISTAAWYIGGEFWIKDSTSGRNDTDVTINTTASHNDTYAFALDLDSSPQTISVYQNNALITNGGAINIDGLSNKTVFPFVSCYNNNGVTFNFGGYTVNSISSAETDENGYGTFEYAPPSGYYALCTKNLAEFG
jgi:hypothetical protein